MADVLSLYLTNANDQHSPVSLIMLSPVSPSTNSNGEVTFMNLTVFPNGGMRILSAMIHLVSSSILAYCIARRVKTVRATSLAELKALSWPRVCVMLILVVSWLFVFGAGVLIHGVGMATSNDACSAGIILCTWLYAISKVLIYAYLIEKVRVHTRERSHCARLMSNIMFVGSSRMGCCRTTATDLTYISCVSFRGYTVRTNPEPNRSLTLLVYDLCMNVSLTCLDHSAAGAALATSIINIATLTAMGHQLGWVCLGSCGTDVALNGIVIFWVTMPMTDSPAQSARGQGQQSSSHKAGSDLPQSPATANSPVVFAHPAAYVPRASFSAIQLNKPSNVLHQPSPRAHDLRNASVLRALPESPLVPTVPTSSNENISTPSSVVLTEDSDKRAASQEPTSQGPIHSLRKLFWLSKQKEKDTTDMTVHVSVVTQHEVELNDLEGGRAKQDDGESIEQSKQQSEWFR
ncbi:hypothetical protein AG1IA_01079 [Rhizoctonia solani AG-1 IA]|uniref:Transmembrane protein n=1 Tax=Thanatephorus cucumeris (strain AG1-IA) TaxID=983506 RepID=L8X8C2_THACA|nr:hypothetical protein AG1IA_01079 [Rhizoctonia solani AG-1 IA]